MSLPKTVPRSFFQSSLELEPIDSDVAAPREHGPRQRARWPFTLMLAGAALAMVTSDETRAATDLDSVEFSGDSWARLPTGSGPTDPGSDSAIFDYDLTTATGTVVTPSANLDAADIDGHDGDRISVDVNADIGGNRLSPRDVFQVSGAILFDGDAAGIPADVNVDAISREPSTGELIFSIDASANLDGIVYAPDDLIRWDGNAFSLFESMELGANIDALHILDTGSYLISLDATENLDGLTVQDEDVIEVSGGGFELSFTPRDLHASWEGADLDAFWAQRAPIPGQLQWTATPAEAFEDAGSVVLTIERVNGDEGSSTVQWSTVDDSATSGADFLGASGSRSFSDGETTETVTITLLDDGAIEGTEQFFVDLTGISSGNATIGAPSRVTVLIRDDEDFVFADGFED